MGKILGFMSKVWRDGTEEAIERTLDDMGSKARKRAKVNAHGSLHEFFSRDSRKLVNPIDPYQVDVVPWIEWDRINLGANGATTATQYSYFTTPQGQGGKTKLDTSLARPQQLEAPEYINAVNLGFALQGNVFKDDVDALDSNYWVEFWVGKKTYAEGPWRCFPSGFVKSGFTTRADEAWYELGTDGISYDLRLPAGLNLGSDDAPIITNGLIGTVIGVNESFKLNMYADAGFVIASPVALYQRAFISGVKVRGVS